MSIIAGIIVALIGKIFTKFEKNEFDLIFWITVLATILVIIAKAVVVYNISRKTKEIKDI